MHGRKQRVVVESIASEWSPVTSGVPQGSILGHMLFLLFINDLPNVIPQTASTGLYADDAKLYRAITSNEDSACLQTALTCAEVWPWSADSNITFNTSKCKIMTISRRRNPLIANYHLGSADLKRVDGEVDLGITLTSNLCWNAHISLIVSKANKTLGLLRRTCYILTVCDVRRALYLSLVKAQLCYATEIWSPSQYTNKIKLERVQRRATRWILQTQDVPYKDRLKMLNLLPLSYDREMKDLTYFFKLLNGFYDLNIPNFVSFVSHNRTRNCKNSSLVHKVPSCKTSSFLSSFFNRIVPLWNYVCKIACPADLRGLIVFKSFLLKTYVQLLVSSFNVDMPCTWYLYRSCSCHRSY